MAQQVSDLYDFKLITTSSKREFNDNNLIKDQSSVDSRYLYTIIELL